MKIAAVICEYNPFHNGHAYQLEETRRRTGADYVICLMSGDFVQRGTPAVFSKYDRAHSALFSGADLVLELPTLWAASSADYFAGGAVAVLNGLGCVDNLSFGAECEDLNLLMNIAEALCEESPQFKSALKTAQKEGKTFAAAEAEALRNVLKDAEHLTEILQQPNNILAISYLKALHQTGSRLTPLLIQRKGSNYNDCSLQESYSSASAIRAAMKEPSLLEQIHANLPEESFRILKVAISNHAWLEMNDFSPALYYALARKCQSGDLMAVADGGADLANRTEHLLPGYLNASSFAEDLKTRQITQAHINRFLTHALLAIDESLRAEAVSAGYVPYARVLGIRKDAQPLLKKLHEKSSIPIITNLAKDIPALDVPALDISASDVSSSNVVDPKRSRELLRKVFDLDLFAADLYTKTMSQKTGILYPTEYSRALLTV